MEVVDAPLELLQRLLGREPIPRDLLLAPARLVVALVLGDPSAAPTRSKVASGEVYPPPAASVQRPATALTRTASLGQARAADALAHFRRDQRVRPRAGERLSSGCSRARTVGLRVGGATARTR